MCWVAAPSHRAAASGYVVDMLPWGNRPVGQLPCDAVCVERLTLSTTDAKLAVPCWLEASEPRPTFFRTAYIDFRPKPFGIHTVKYTNRCGW